MKDGADRSEAVEVRGDGAGMVDLEREDFLVGVAHFFLRAFFMGVVLEAG